MVGPYPWIDFEQFVTRHGEPVALGLLENIERSEGIFHREVLDLEARWNAVMNHVSFPAPGVAAWGMS